MYILAVELCRNMWEHPSDRELLKQTLVANMNQGRHFKYRIESIRFFPHGGDEPIEASINPKTGGLKATVVFEVEGARPFSLGQEWVTRVTQSDDDKLF